MRPTTESMGFLDISSGTSEDFNKLIRSVGYDITKVFNMANENESDIDTNTAIILQENLFLQRKIKELESSLNSIKDTIESKASPTRANYLYKTFYTTKDVESQEQILHDPSYGVVTLPYSNNQKLPLLKYSREVLAKNMDIQVEVMGKTINLANDQSLLNIIDGDESTFWVTEVTDKSGTMNSVDMTVTINMPLKLLPNLFINSIGIKPHPVYSMTLNDVTYTNANNGMEARLPSFPLSGNSPDPIQAIDNIKFTFPTIMATSMVFKFTQPYYIQQGAVRKFVVGLRNISLENINITVEEASFMTAFKMPGQGRYFGSIFEPEVITLNNEAYGDAVTHELYYDKGSTTPFAFGSNISADIDTVYIKTTLKRVGETIPALKGIKLKYLPK